MEGGGGITGPLQLKFDKSNAGNIQYEHITPLLRDLHWLPVRERIEFKLAVLVLRCLHRTW